MAQLSGEEVLHSIEPIIRASDDGPTGVELAVSARFVAAPTLAACISSARLPQTPEGYATVTGDTSAMRCIQLHLCACRRSLCTICTAC